jgi:hypothetical protein
MLSTGYTARRVVLRQLLTSVSTSQTYMVGATGFEPVTSSVSANNREPLC